jgi:transcriptional regulator GlxA family with amidase domain
MKDKNGKLSSIVEWIRANLQKEITVKELSERYNYNSDHLSRLFKKHLGVTPIKYVNAVKVLKAKELLSLTDKSIKEISYETGFKDEKYFMKLFKSAESLTPTEYRQAYHKMHVNNV